MTTIERLGQILAKNSNKRIVVIGTTCTGKTTLLKDIPEGVELSSLLPPPTQKERGLYYKVPLTREVNDWFVARGKGAKIQPGKPAFGTVLTDNTELVVYLKIDDELLEQRTQKRDVNTKDAKVMQEFIEEQIEASGLPVIIVPIA